MTLTGQAAGGKFSFFWEVGLAGLATSCSVKDATVDRPCLCRLSGG